MRDGGRARRQRALAPPVSIDWLSTAILAVHETAARVMSGPIRIAGRCIGREFPPFVIAEMSGNHNQSLDRALAIVDAAARSGAHALKIQTYTADTMTLDIKDREFRISDPHSLWLGRSLYDLYEEASTPWDWHASIFERARA